MRAAFHIVGARRVLFAAGVFACAASLAFGETRFIVPGTDSHERLEVEEGYAAGRIVCVPLERDDGLPAGCDMLSAAGVDYPVAWAAGETKKYVSVALPGGIRAGGEVPLALHPESGGDSLTNRIAIVSPVANSLSNPWWVGERTAASLGWGEWTMDVDAATNKASKAGGAAFTLIYFSGVLWCPWCQGLESGVLGTAAFKAWCRRNQVSLAVLDNPRRSATDHVKGDRPYVVSSVPDGAPPTLLRYESGRNNVIGRMVSGASYLSRKGISPIAAEAKLQDNHTLGYRGGAFAAPEAWRTSYPTLILVRKDGMIAGRFNYYAPTTTSFDHDENMARLDDLLRLASGSGEMDNYVSTTTRSLLCGGLSASCTFQINDKTEVFRLASLPAGTVEFRVSGKTADRPVQLSVIRLADGGEQETLATGTDAVVCSFGADEAAPVFLKLVAFAATEKYGADTTFRLDVESAVVEAPEEECSAALYVGFNAAASFSTNVCSVSPSGKIKVKVLSGKMPSGVKLVYDQATKKIVLSGIAKKPGEYHVEYAFEGALDEASSLAFTVKDPAVENSALSKAWKVTLPLLRRREDGLREMGGVLDISAKANNSISAKYASAPSGKIVFFKGRWSSMVGGIAAAELEAKGGETLSVMLAADGQIEARIKADSHSNGYDSGALVANIDGLGAAFGGSYTVALPEAVGNAGSGYLTLSVGNRDGKVKWKGMLANGQSVSGSAVMISGSDGLGVVPVFRATSKWFVSALLAVRPNAGEASTRRAVRLADGTVAVWSVGGAVHDCKAWGSWFGDVDSIARLCLESSISTTLNLWFGDGALSMPLADVNATASTIELARKDASLRLSCRKKDGVFKGAVKFDINGKRMTAKYAGVLIPGWYDCGCEIPDPADSFNIAESVPFAVGTAFYADKTSGDAGRRSVAVQIGEKE